LWQGKGFNASLTGGARLTGYGVELTFKPQLAFSQNVAFGYIKPEGMTGANYAGKAADYGYFWGIVDAPQRFGDEPLFTYDWGDSEIRYTWKTLTVGFGTQAIWLGPAQLNPILHSNNAPSYPKLDIGLRRQPVTIPWVNWYIGDVEARIWTGYLSESEYFDNDDSNDHHMFHGLSLAYAPSFLPGLTFFANRVSIVPWSLKNMKYILPSDTNADAVGEVSSEDQKASFGASWIFPQAGFEVYGELGVDDYVPGKLEGYIRYPFHTMTYTVGLKKGITFSSVHKIYGELIFEWNNMEMSQDFQFQWPYSPYFHGNQGYTNKGQWLGMGSGWGGNSQYLELKVYYPRGTSSFFIHRNNPDNNYIYSKTIGVATGEELYEKKYFTSWKANFIIGISTKYYISDIFSIDSGFAYNLIINSDYQYSKTDFYKDILSHNFSFQFGIKYNF
jgi:hypothetical protein